MPNTMTSLDGGIYRSTSEQARGVAPADIGMTHEQRFLSVRCQGQDAVPFCAMAEQPVVQLRPNLLCTLIMIGSGVFYCVGWI